jgi:hypothetical protein
MIMDVNKQAFIKAYQANFGIVAGACKSVNISRTTYYNWLKDDPEFKAAVEAIEPVNDLLDLAENKLVHLINKGNPAAIFFLLKTKGKERGYIERQEIDASITPINWNEEKTYLNEQ